MAGLLVDVGFGVVVGVGVVVGRLVGVCSTGGLAADPAGVRTGVEVAAGEAPEDGFGFGERLAVGELVGEGEDDVPGVGDEAATGVGLEPPGAAGWMTCTPNPVPAPSAAEIIRMLTAAAWR